MEGTQSVNHSALSVKKLHDSPNTECPWRRSQICLLPRPVDFTGSSDGVNVRAEEEEVNKDVYKLVVCQLYAQTASKQSTTDLESDAVLPGVGHVV